MRVFMIIPVLLFFTLPVFADSDTIELKSPVKKNSSKAKTPVQKFDTRFDAIIDKYAQAYAIDPYLVKCIIKVESDFNPEAVSSAGAAGLMQLMIDIANSYGVNDRTDPDQNIRAGSAHLAHLLKEFKWDVPLSVAAYHSGSGRVKRSNGVPPIKATMDYVNLVMRYYTGGSGDYSGSVRKLYIIVDKDGTLNIRSR